MSTIKRVKRKSASTSASSSSSSLKKGVRNVRQEDLSHIPHETFREAIVAPSLRDSLQEVVKRIHLDPERPYNVNAYVASPDAAMGLCYAKGKWMPMQARQIGLLVLTNAASVMCEHNDDPYEDEYDAEQSKRFDEFFERLERDDVALNDTLKTLAEGKEIVERIHGGALPPTPAPSQGQSHRQGRGQGSLQEEGEEEDEEDHEEDEDYYSAMEKKDDDSYSGHN